MINVLDCKYHMMSDDGEYDICLKKKFKTEFDCYDTFIRKCEKCKSKCSRRKQAKGKDRRSESGYEQG